MAQSYGARGISVLNRLAVDHEYDQWRPEGEVLGGSTPIGQFNDRSTVKHALQNTQNDCHQWLSDISRVHRPGLRPEPR